MCSNVRLQEKYVEERLENMRRTAERQHLIASLSIQRRSRVRHWMSRVGTGLVVLGRWLEHVERSDKGVVSSATYK